MRLKLLAAYGSAVLVLVVAWVGIAAINSQNESQERVYHAVEVRRHLRNVYEVLLAAHVDQSSYLLLGEPESLTAMRSIRGRVASELAALLASIKDTEQLARVTALVPIIEREISTLEARLRLMDTRDRATVLASIQQNKQRFDHTHLENAVSEMRTAEEVLIEERKHATLGALETTRVLLISGAGIAFLLATFVITRLRKSVLELEKAYAIIAAQAIEVATQTRALERTVKDLDQFAYVASHDLKAPLRGITMLAQWIQEDLKDQLDGQGREYLRLMQVRVGRMEALVAGVLAYARAGRTALATENIDGNALVREVIDMLAQAPGGGTVVIDSPLPTIHAVKIPFQQIWLNLISNALKHGASEGGVVRVGAYNEAGEVVYRVADKGPGIEPEYHDRIFGLFQTLSARDKVEGTGIGLAVVKKLVEQQGGRVWLTSTLGEGTTFFFVYPASEPTRTPMASFDPAGSPHPSVAPSAGCKVPSQNYRTVSPGSPPEVCHT